MDTELKSLEQKLSQLVDFCHQLRDENHELRQQLATEQNQSKQLHEKLNGAKTRLQDLLKRIPES
jgi:cell division protein ZapB